MYGKVTTLYSISSFKNSLEDVIEWVLSYRYHIGLDDIPMVNLCSHDCRRAWSVSSKVYTRFWS